MFLVPLIIAVLNIGIGLVFGTLFTDKQVGGIFAIFVNVTTWLSGTWFELDMVGGTFQSIAHFLPFVHTLNAAKAILQGAYVDMLQSLSIVIGYTILITIFAMIAFKRKMRA